MLKSYSELALGVLVTVVAVRPLRADLSAELVQVPINAAAIVDEPSLANAQTWQLQVTSDHPILSFELYVRLSGGTFYQSPFAAFGGDTGPVFPELISHFPAAQFDSYLDLPVPASFNYLNSDDYHDLYDGPRDFTPSASHHWVSTTYDGPPLFGDAVAQMTIVPNGGSLDHHWIARFYEKLPQGGLAERVVTFPESLGSPFGADLNFDFRVDTADLSLWSENFGLSGSLSPPRSTYDLDNDGDTDEFDYGILQANLGMSGATREQGDVNGNGVVTLDDFKMLYQYNLGHKWNPADVDQDQDVDGHDFLRWQQQLGNGFPAVSQSVSTIIPEPTGIALVIAAALGLIAFRRDSWSRNCS